MSRQLFVERPMRTRIREFGSGIDNELIIDVDVRVRNGSCGRGDLELSRLATELLIEHLRNEEN